MNIDKVIAKAIKVKETHAKINELYLFAGKNRVENIPDSLGGDIYEHIEHLEKELSLYTEDLKNEVTN